jgi:16S rRNA (uracil1498-N3)-methyltransferase
MLYEGEAPQGLKNVLNHCVALEYLLLIGPEGGFSPEEVKLCQDINAHIVTMGPRILRTETASLAALTAVMYQCGDLGGG